MSTILLRLAGPLQSWGAESKFNSRLTNREPTKSGVIGMIAAALGRTREDSIDDLCELKFAVRTDQVGKQIKDFHTAHTFDGKQAFISNRYYLCDAVFVVALEGESALIDNIHYALEHPVYPLFLGRRSCPPSGQIVIGRSEESAVAALSLCSVDWQAKDWYRKKQPETVFLEIVRDADFSEQGAFEVRDLPITFSQSYRKYAYRSVKSEPKAVKVPNLQTETTHDAFAELEESNVSVPS
jgi:CRISPR system Cascade subunit CasD